MKACVLWRSLLEKTSEIKKHDIAFFYALAIGQHVLDTNAEKQLS
jgi:hypothetical protein